MGEQTTVCRITDPKIVIAAPIANATTNEPVRSTYHPGHQRRDGTVNISTEIANGTESVTLYEASNGRLPGWNTTAFKPISETVSNVFPNDAVNNPATQDVSTGREEIWPQVLEKAVATLNGGYAAIANGGSPVIAMEELTGRAASFMSPASLTLATLQSFSAAGDLVVMDTLSSGALQTGLFNSHAYMFEGVTGTGATALVHLGNPWLFDQPTAMLVSQLPRGSRRWTWAVLLEPTAFVTTWARCVRPALRRIIIYVVNRKPDGVGPTDFVEPPNMRHITRRG